MVDVEKILIKALVNRLQKSDILRFVDKVITTSSSRQEVIFTFRMTARNDIRFSVDYENNVYFIPYEKFRFLINDNINLNKMLVKGMESLAEQRKPDLFHMELFKFAITIAKYVDNNDEGYSVPYIQQSYVKEDIRRIMEKLDGWGKTKEYRDIIEKKGNSKYVF